MHHHHLEHVNLRRTSPLMRRHPSCHLSEHVLTSWLLRVRSVHWLVLNDQMYSVELRYCTWPAPSCRASRLVRKKEFTCRIGISFCTFSFFPIFSRVRFRRIAPSTNSERWRVKNNSGPGRRQVFRWLYTYMYLTYLYAFTYDSNECFKQLEYSLEFLFNKANNAHIVIDKIINELKVIHTYALTSVVAETLRRKLRLTLTSISTWKLGR
jgi:hypothetical protein